MIKLLILHQKCRCHTNFYCNHVNSFFSKIGYIANIESVISVKPLFPNLWSSYLFNTIYIELWLISHILSTRVVDLQRLDQRLQIGLRNLELLLIHPKPAETPHQPQTVLDFADERARSLVVDGEGQRDVVAHFTEELDGAGVLVVVNEDPLFAAAGQLLEGLVFHVNFADWDTDFVVGAWR